MKEKKWLNAFTWNLSTNLLLEHLSIGFPYKTYLVFIGKLIGAKKKLTRAQFIFK